MKKTLLSITALFVALFIMQSCQKEVHQSEKIKEITIDTTLAAGTTYQLYLAPLGTDDDIANIIQQGSNFSVSALTNESDMFTTVYQYSPAAKASGTTDHVVLSISENPAGRPACSKDSTIIYLNFTIKKSVVSSQ